jgi:hypothetical protein
MPGFGQGVLEGIATHRLNLIQELLLWNVEGVWLVSRNGFTYCIDYSVIGLESK